MVLTRSNRDVHTFHSTHTMREKSPGKQQDKALTPSLECFLPLPTPSSSYYPSSSSSFAFLTTTPFGSSYKEDDGPFPFPPAPRLVRQDAYLGLAADTDDEEEKEDEEEEMPLKGAPHGLLVHTTPLGLDDATAAATAAVLAAVRNLSCNSWSDALLISPLSMSGSSTSSSSSFFPSPHSTTTTAAATSIHPVSFVPSRPSFSAASSSSFSSSTSTHAIAPSLPASTTSN